MPQTFNFTVNNKFHPTSRFISTGSCRDLIANLSFTAQQILDEGLLVYVSTNLRPILIFHPKTGEIISVQSRLPRTGSLDPLSIQNHHVWHPRELPLVPCSCIGRELQNE
jgi:hypothetical protein